MLLLTIIFVFADTTISYSYKMAFLLTIDTAMERGSVGFFRSGEQLHILQNASPKDHAAFVQAAIADLAKATGTSLEGLDAIAVVAGPGSYTGVRVGLATAKGICYALDKKLILVNTLDVIARASILASGGKDYLYSPMIDARRDDVFTGVYDNRGAPVEQKKALTVTPDTFRSFLREKRLVLSGSGAAKAARIIDSDNVVVSDTIYEVGDINTIAQEKYGRKAFADVAYSEPDYLKAFYSTAKPATPNTKIHTP